MGARQAGSADAGGARMHQIPSWPAERERQAGTVVFGSAKICSVGVTGGGPTVDTAGACPMTGNWGTLLAALPGLICKVLLPSTRRRGC